MEPPEETTARPEPGDGGGTDSPHFDALPALSRPSRIVIALAMAAVAVGVAFHLMMVFLHVAPQNTLSSRNSQLLNDYIYPEFEQNWKLFAPNPLQQNIHVWARAEVRKDGGGTETTGWVDLTAMDAAKIRGSIAPSHTRQNELRRAWGFYTSTHGQDGKPIGQRGILSQQYVQRIVETRFGPRLNGGDVERVQVRTGTTAVAPPPWSDEKIDTRTSFQVLPWWIVTRPGAAS
jgi:hypothetical protein